MNLNMSGSSDTHLATWIMEIKIFWVLKMKHRIFITNVTESLNCSYFLTTC